MKRRNKTQNRRLTAEDRASFALERQSLVGMLLTQQGLEGALVIKHVRGSQYLVRMPDGTEVFASHKKPRSEPSAETFLTEGGWQIWENRR